MSNHDEFDKFGKSTRFYDDYNDEDDGDKIVRLLNSYGSLNRDFDKNYSSTQLAQNLIEQGLSSEILNQLGIFREIKKSVNQFALLNALTNLIDDVAYSIWDFLSWRKVKTSLTILGGIGAGIGVGALIGTFILPGIGTLVGGATASTIGGVLAGIGGGIGTGILGGALGSFLGKKTADKIFKYEKRFQPSKRFTNAIKRNFNTNNGKAHIDDTIDLINAYLYNRAKSVQSVVLKQYIKKLRQSFIYNANPRSVEQLICFFAEELKFLHAKNVTSPADLGRYQDIENIKFILNNLLTMKEIDTNTTQLLNELISIDDQTKVKTDEKNELHRPIVQTARESINNDMLFSQMHTSSDSPRNLAPDRLWKNVLSTLSDRGYNVKKDESPMTPGHYHATYQWRPQDSAVISPLTFELTQQVREDKMTVGIMSSQANSSVTTDEIEATVQQVSLYYAQLGEETATVIVQAAGDHSYAAQLFLALTQAGFSPELDEDEYPQDSQERKQVLKQIDRLASQPRVGGGYNI